LAHVIRRTIWVAVAARAALGVYSRNAPGQIAEPVRVGAEFHPAERQHVLDRIALNADSAGELRRRDVRTYPMPTASKSNPNKAASTTKKATQGPAEPMRTIAALV